MPRKIIRACTAHHSNNDESQKVRYNSFFIVGVEEAFNRSMICSLYLLYVRMTMVTCLTRTYSHTDTHTVLYTISSHSSCIRIAKSVKVLKVTHSFTHRIVRHFVTLDFVRWQRHCRMRHKCQSSWLSRSEAKHYILCMFFYLHFLSLSSDVQSWMSNSSRYGGVHANLRSLICNC